MSEVKGVYAANGDFIPFSRESLSTEIATRENAGLALVDLGSIWLNQLPDSDPILRDRSQRSGKVRGVVKQEDCERYVQQWRTRE